MFNFYIGVGNLIVQIESSELSPLHLATDTLSMKMKEQPIYSMENLPIVAVLRPKTGKTLFGPVNFSVFI